VRETQSEDAEATTILTRPMRADEAFIGVLGDIVKRIEPHSEADPAAILIQGLVAFGAAIGRNAHFRVERDVHFGNLFALVVGETASGHKGVSRGWVEALLPEEWVRGHVGSGLSSGEGLIYRLRDDEATGKQLLLIEPEFSAQLKRAKWEGSSLSQVIRDVWDRGDFSILTKKPVRVEDCHVAIIAHATPVELRRYLDPTDVASGFANRFLLVWSEGSKLLPFGGEMDAKTKAMLEGLTEKFREAIEYGKDLQEVPFLREACPLWAEYYSELRQPKPGALNQITARAAPQVRRLAMLFTLLDRQCRTDIKHLKAARAVWDYALASAAYIFGSSTGDPVADKIFAALKNASHEGLTRTQISGLFSGNKEAQRIEEALAGLARQGMIEKAEQAATGGRPPQVWRVRAA